MAAIAIRSLLTKTASISGLFSADAFIASAPEVFEKSPYSISLASILFARCLQRCPIACLTMLHLQLIGWAADKADFLSSRANQMFRCRLPPLKLSPVTRTIFLFGLWEPQIMNGAFISVSAFTWDCLRVAVIRMNHYADDLAAVIETLDLKDVVLVGHSTGGGEVTRYIGRHGTARVAKVVLLSAIPPLMLKTDANPEGLPIAPFDEIRDGVLTDRSQYYRDLAYPFYGANRDGSTVSQGARDAFWLMSMTVGIKAAYDCVKAFSETDLTEDLKKIDVPTLILHGDDDQIVPIGAAALKSAKIVPNATLKIYPGGPHGLTGTHEQEFNKDLLAFLTS